MGPYNEKQFTLDNSNPKKEFTLKYSFATLKISRIIITSHLGKKNEEWTKIMDKIIIDFKSSITSTGHQSGFVLPLIGKLTANHVNPVFDVNIEFPQENVNNITALIPFFDKIEISLKSQKDAMESFSLTFIYQDTPGLETI
jgi:hypothetical protein